jgi:Rieske Fe-S protein
MSINRREFVILSCAALAGCASDGGGEGAPSISAGPVDAGPAADFAADGVYDRFHNQGFFIVRQGPRLFALSSVCTHRRCPIKAVPDHTFYCKCHGSTFATDGHVTEGPAIKDLPVLPTSINGNGNLIVRVT